MTRVKLEEIEGVSLYVGMTSNDLRGSFVRYFDNTATASKNWNMSVNALSMATNIKSGTVRDLHFQTRPFEEEKVVFCTEGRIFDVIVDLRKGSQTQGKWAGVELDSHNPASLSLPKGIAHGYQTLTTTANVFYALSVEFSPNHAFTLNYTDTGLDIPWPLKTTHISEKDEAGISLPQAIQLSESAL